MPKMLIAIVGDTDFSLGRFPKESGRTKTRRSERYDSGMGLCMDHLFREELLVSDIVDWGLGGEKIEYPRTLPRFICGDCKVAIDQRRRR